MSLYLARLEYEDVAAKIYSACGRLAINWGQLEVIVDITIVHLRNRQRHPSVGFKYPDFPVSFSKKCDEIKDRLKNDPDLADLRAPMTMFLSEAKTLHNLRVTVVHGNCEGLQDGKVRFMVSDMHKFGGWRTKRHPLAEIERSADRMLTLHDEGEPLAAEVLRRGRR